MSEKNLAEIIATNIPKKYQIELSHEGESKLLKFNSIANFVVISEKPICYKILNSTNEIENNGTFDVFMNLRHLNNEEILEIQPFRLIVNLETLNGKIILDIIMSVNKETRKKIVELKEEALKQIVQNMSKFQDFENRKSDILRITVLSIKSLKKEDYSICFSHNRKKEAVKIKETVWFELNRKNSIRYKILLGDQIVEKGKVSIFDALLFICQYNKDSSSLNLIFKEKNQHTELTFELSISLVKKSVKKQKKYIQSEEYENKNVKENLVDKEVCQEEVKIEQISLRDDEKIQGTEGNLNIMILQDSYTASSNTGEINQLKSIGSDLKNKMPEIIENNKMHELIENVKSPKPTGDNKKSEPLEGNKKSSCLIF
ncbi:hypothetical protein SteCoe_22269 [Stentor coeruleus]|uniref:Uncharacterized protein n=1 Tax=Stentor coeruleus TaxID=5963 RepID=A0A1R2BMQ9_9CILI|nr:hypothetical protein SteCoe_22269 [Stentor coeruleus]